MVPDVQLVQAEAVVVRVVQVGWLGFDEKLVLEKKAAVDAKGVLGVVVVVGVGQLGLDPVSRLEGLHHVDGLRLDLGLVVL